MPGEEFVTDISVWAIVFAIGSLFSWLSWLTLRHFKYCMPSFTRLFGSDTTREDGHIDETDDRFEEVKDKQDDLKQDVAQIGDDVEKVEFTQSLVIANQKKIAEGVGVDLNAPDFYRGGNGGDRDPSVKPSDD